MAKIECMEIKICSSVKNTSFKKEIVHKATELGITGFISTEEEHTSFIHAEGFAQALQNLLSWVSKGAHTSNDRQLTVTWENPTKVYEKFAIAKYMIPSVNIPGSPQSTELEKETNIPKAFSPPKHVALIPRGSYIWAKLRHLDQSKGYQVTAQALSGLIPTLQELKIKYFSVIIFSSLSWKLPTKEVRNLLDLIYRWIDSFQPILNKNKIKFTTIGRKDRLPAKLVELIKKIENNTKNNKKMNIVFAIDYSGRDEILRCINTLIDKKLPRVDEKSFSTALDTSGIPDPEIIITTAGKLSLDDFLPWQSIKSMIYSSSKYFPDFTPEDLKEILVKYFKRTKN